MDTSSTVLAILGLAALLIGMIAGLVQVVDYLERKREQRQRKRSGAQAVDGTHVPQQAGSLPNPSVPDQFRGAAASNFVGRDRELEQLEAVVEGGAKVVLIRGEGGVGKTALALNFLARQKLTMILELWMAKDVGDIGSVEGRVEEWLKGSFGEEPGTDFSITLERLRRRLRDRRHRVGILIDNLEPALDDSGRFLTGHRRYVELLRVLADPTVTSVTIITSRESLREPALTVTDFPIGGLNLGAWQQYFVRAGVRDDFHVLMQMHKAFSGNPKAMTILIGAIKTDFAGDAAAYWRVHGEDVLSEQDLDNLVNEQFDRLSQVNPPAYRLLCRLGCYRYQDIPTVPLAGALCQLWDVSEELRLRVFGTLQDRSLVEFAQARFWLHPTIRTEAVSRLRTSSYWLEANSSAAEFWTESVATVETTDDALTALEAYYHYVAVGDFEEAGRIILSRRPSPGRQLAQGGEPLDAAFYRLSLFQQQVAAITSILDQVPLGYTKGRLLDVLGLSLRYQGRLADALKCQEELDRIAAAVDSQELRVEALALAGYCNTELWELDIARAAFNQLVSIAEGTDYERYAVVAWAYLAYLGSYSGSFQLEETRENIRRVEASFNRPDLNTWRKAYSALLIAVALRNLHDVHKGFEASEQAIVAARSSGYSQVLGRALSCKATLYADKRDLKRALRLHGDAISLLEEIGAKCDLAEVYYQAGITHRLHRDTGRSQECFAKALALFEQIGAPKQIARVQTTIAARV